MKFLRQPRLRLTTGKARIGHLLLVSGPSGSGKTTFLRQLATGSLAPDILAALPAGASDWPQTNGRRIISGGSGSRGRPRVGPQPDGLVLHYDFMRAFETPVADYAEDRALAALALAEAVTVIALHAPPERLADELARRPPRTRRLDPLRNTARSLGVGMPGKPDRVYDRITEHERHRRLVEHYRQAGWLDEWYARWQSFLEESCRDRQCRGVHVEWAAEGVPRFRLLAETALPA